MYTSSNLETKPGKYYVERAQFEIKKHLSHRKYSTTNENLA